MQRHPDILSVMLATALMLSLSAASYGHGRGKLGRPRTAPNDQVEPLEPGTKPDIPVAERVTLKVKLVDADTKRLLPHRVHIEDADGNYYPPEGHLEIEEPRWHTTNVSYEPNVINRGKVWAMIESGSFTVHLRARKGYKLQVSHGLEYEQKTFTLDLADMAGKTVSRTFSLPRGINMRAKGWMSADTHVHNLSPKGALRQMGIEGIDYVNLMFIGPGHPLWKRGYVTGKPWVLSTKDKIIFVSQEVRDANQGHMTLLGMSEPIQPIRAYTGRELAKRMKGLPNEPLNWEVWERMRRQNGLAFHAHYLFWPGHGSAVGAALKKLDGVEWLQTDIVARGPRTRQNIEVPGFKLTGGGQMWYHMLNCGARVPIIGGTDKMSAARVLGGSSRTYAGVTQRTHKGFMDALRKGRTFATNGPLLDLKAASKGIGSELKVTHKGPFAVVVTARCFTQRPITYFEIVQDGKVVHHVDVKPGQKTITVRQSITFERSGWIAVRAGHVKRDRDNWERVTTAAHSSPIYVTVNGRPRAVRKSAEYMVGRVEVAIRWAENEAMWSSPAYKARALASFRQALDFYKAALKRAIEDGQ